MGLSYSEKIMMAFGHAQVTGCDLTFAVPDEQAKRFLEKRIKALHLDDTMPYTISVVKPKEQKCTVIIDEVSNENSR